MTLPDSLHYLDAVIFGVFPYVAMVLFFFITINRYVRMKFSYSTLSSQFLENKHHFWALVPFHYGLIVVLAGHVIAFLIPRSILMWNSVPLRLYVLEVSGFICALLTFIGIFNVIIRRVTNSRVRKVTLTSDWLVYALLVIQITTGMEIALMYRWGSSWFASAIAPYLWSLIKLSPEIHLVTSLPLLIKFHIFGAFLLIAVFPFTRLVHVLVTPNPYLWRRPQVVRWYTDRAKRRAEAAAR